MGLLERLLGFAAARDRIRDGGAKTGTESSLPVTGRLEPTLSFGAAGDRFVRVSALDFFGPYVRSPSGRFVLAWRDADEAGYQGGHRDSGPGRFLLFEDGRLVASGRAERPNDGQVADDGTFSINDWRFGDGLKGTYRAYRPDGTLILERHFAANLFNAGLSGDGGIGVCQACNAPDSPDSSLLCIFDLRGEVELAAWVPESGWADEYSFPDAGVIRLHYRKGEILDYSIGGAFRDRDRWIVALGTQGRAHQLAKLIETEGAALTSSVVADALAGLETAMAVEGFDERYRPMALKVAGLCREKLGDTAIALARYREAVALDPRIGLKRRVAQIERLSEGKG